MLFILFSIFYTILLGVLDGLREMCCVVHFVLNHFHFYFDELDVCSVSLIFPSKYFHSVFILACFSFFYCLFFFFNSIL